MKRQEAINSLNQWAKSDISVFSRANLARVFDMPPGQALDTSLMRLEKAGVLRRLARGYYAPAYMPSLPNDPLPQLVAAMRPGEANYISLESALADHGVISQQPLGGLTIMTTGRSGRLSTKFGPIEFTHTQRELTDIMDGLEDPDAPLPRATAKTAYRDLKRVGRNLHLVDLEELSDES